MLSNTFRYPACVLCLTMILVFAAYGQTTAEPDEATVKAVVMGMALFQQGHYIESLPFLETAVKGMPNEPKLRFIYGFALVAKSKQVSNSEEGKQLSAKALEQFKTAKQLGLEDEANDEFIRILSGGPRSDLAKASHMYSQNDEADKLTAEGEDLFAQSKYDEALKKYEKALSIDPKIYQAALAGGDCYTQKSDWDNAEKWYQRAIAIDPNRETAYRYSGTPLMKQKKYDLARDRYIESVVTEPYNRMSYRGINQWADITGAKLADRAVDIPNVSFDDKDRAVPTVAIKSDDAVNAPWLAYLATRESWKKERFAKTFPKENAYRHSLPEEIESLRAAVKTAAEQKSPNKQFDLLAKLDSEGLLEAYVLITHADGGIAKDHPAYLKDNRAKLRQFMLNYVIAK